MGLNDKQLKPAAPRHWWGVLNNGIWVFSLRDRLQIKTLGLTYLKFGRCDCPKPSKELLKNNKFNKCFT